MALYGYGSIPIDTIFSGLFTSINPSYFDVNKRGTRVFTYPHIAFHDLAPQNLDFQRLLGFAVLVILLTLFMSTISTLRALEALDVVVRQYRTWCP